MKTRERRLKIMKPRVTKKSTTFIFGWTCDNDMWTSREKFSDERARGGDKTHEV
jgi:hypothetical protein